MEPLTLIGLATAAGFLFNSQSGSKSNSESSSEKELDYRANINVKENKTEQVFDISDIEVLDEYEVVKLLIEHKFPLAFVTGGAGTGKSTFIQWLSHHFDGSLLLAAPTGIAAINIGGKTLHSLCQLPPAFVLRPDIKKIRNRRAIKEAKLLIIDEISNGKCKFA